MVTERQLLFVLFTSLFISIALVSIGFGGVTFKQIGVLFAGALIGIAWYYPTHEESDGVLVAGWFLFPSLVALAAIPLLTRGVIVPFLFSLSFLFALMLAAPPVLLLIRKKLFSSA